MCTCLHPSHRVSNTVVLTLPLRIAGMSSLKEQGFEIAGSGVNAACFVPRKLHISTKGVTDIDSDPFRYSEEKVFGRLVSRELSLATQYALYASQLAVLHAGLLNVDTTAAAVANNPKQQHHSLLQLECGGLRAGAAIASGGIVRTLCLKC